jgi:hypothetical protein
MSNLQADIPLINEAFVDPQTGRITESWFIFLMQLWRRTGGAAPPSGALTLADVISLDQTFSPPQVQKDGIRAFETTFAPAIPDAQPLPDVVVSRPTDQPLMADMVFPALAPDIADQTFSSGTDFTAGTTTALTLNTSFASAARLWVFFDAAFQGDDQYSLSGTTLTFTSAIPVGTNKVYVKGLK